MKFQQTNYSDLGFNPDGSGHGVTVPSLSVNGQTNIRGTIKLNSLTWPANDGSGNQVLVTDGWGNLTWLTPIVTGSPVSATTLTATSTVTLNGMIYPSTDGSSGQILTTNGSNHLSWTTPSLSTGPVNATTLTASGTVTLDGLTYPSTDGTSGQVLTTNGSGTLSFGNVNSTRHTITISTGSLADQSTYNGAATGHKSYGILSVSINAAARIRIYTDVASRTADASRDQYTDPNANSGLIAEFITTGSTTLPTTPMILGFNNESTPTTDMPMAITNLSGATTNITVTMSVLKLES